MSAERQRLGPGIYAVGDRMEIDLPELIMAAGGDPRDPRAQARAMSAAAEIAREYGIPLVVDEDERRN